MDWASSVSLSSLVPQALLSCSSCCLVLSLFSRSSFPLPSLFHCCALLPNPSPSLAHSPIYFYLLILLSELWTQLSTQLGFQALISITLSKLWNFRFSLCKRRILVPLGPGC